MRKIFVSLLSVLLVAACLVACCSCSITMSSDGADIVLGASRNTAVAPDAAEDGVVFEGASSDEEILANIPVVEAPDPREATRGLFFKKIPYDVEEGGETVRKYVCKVISYSTHGLDEGEALSKDIYVPYTYEGWPVVEIASRAFESVSINSITLPYTLTKISSKAFLNSTVASVEIPAGVASIADDAFIGCDASAITTAADSVRYTAANGYLMDGTVLVRGTGNGEIPADVTEIADYAFSGCTALTEITVPATVTKIGDAAFAGCRSLSAATIEAEIAVLPSRIFDGCSSLAALDLPDTITEYGYACLRATAFTTITVPYGVTAIGSSAFENCTKATGVVFETVDVDGVATTSVENIGGNAFLGCTALTEITFPRGVKNLGGNICNGCIGLTAVNLSNTIEEIGAAAFYGCYRIKSVYIPKSVNRVGYGIFYGFEKSAVISLEGRSAGAAWNGGWNVYYIENAQESGKIATVVNYLTVLKNVPPSN